MPILSRVPASRNCALKRGEAVNGVNLVLAEHSMEHFTSTEDSKRHREGGERRKRE